MFAPSDYPMMAIFGTWTVFSLLRQVSERHARWARKWDVFQLIPPWKFFRGQIGDVDFHLFYRDSLPGGGFSAWIRIVPEYRKGPLSFLWNPGRRLQKSLITNAEFLIRARRTGRESQGADLALRAYASRCRFPSDATSRQYAVMQSRGFDSPDFEIVRCSEPFSLGPRP
jgi:hypothetical protein